MYAGKVGVHNMFSNQTQSEYVIIDSERNCGNRAASFNIAYEGGFLTHIGNGFYKLKRKVADNLGLIIMADADQKVY